MPSDRWEGLRRAAHDGADYWVTGADVRNLLAERDALAELVRLVGDTVCDLYGDGRSWIDCQLELTPAQDELIERITRENP